MTRVVLPQTSPLFPPAPHHLFSLWRQDLPIEADQVLAGARLYLLEAVSGDPLGWQAGQTPHVHVGYRAAQDSLRALLRLLLLLRAIPLGRGDLQVLKRSSQSLRSEESLEEIAVAAAMRVRRAGGIRRGRNAASG